jgi:hypothetical protein
MKIACTIFHLKNNLINYWLDGLDRESSACTAEGQLASAQPTDLREYLALYEGRSSFIFLPLKGQCHEIFDPRFFSPIDYT